MILAARQLGWAHSIPDGPDGKRGEKSQIEIARANGGDVTLPPQRCPYLFEWLCQAGPAGADVAAEESSLEDAAIEATAMGTPPPASNAEGAPAAADAVAGIPAS